MTRSRQSPETPPNRVRGRRQNPGTLPPSQMKRRPRNRMTKLDGFDELETCWMSISAAQVKQLRERTGAGMMECKRALEATGGDMQAAGEKMRTEGLAKADKKAGRIAAEGRIVIREARDSGHAVVMEVDCETDFVARGDALREFAEAGTRLVSEHERADVAALYALGDGQASLDDRRRELSAKIGENIGVRRFVRVDAAGNHLSAYTHGGRIGAVVVLKSGDEALARDVALHVAAASPRCIRSDELPAEEVEKEREILLAQAKESGKPDHIVEKMVEGRLRKNLQ